jgi:hypothetical protein
MRNLWKGVLLFPLCVLSGHAGIIAVTGQAVVVPAPSTVLTPSPTQSLIFAEKQDFALPSNLAVDINTPGTFNSMASLTPGTIPTGTLVDSYYLHSGISGTATAPSFFDGSVTFDTPILGVEGLDLSLSGTNSILGLATTTYPTGSVSQGFEFGNPRDSIIISANRRTLTFSNETTGAADDLRIVTAAVPEPSSRLLIGAGVALLALKVLTTAVLKRSSEKRSLEMAFRNYHIT